MFPVLTHPQYLWGVVELPNSPQMVAQVNRTPWPLIALLIAAAGCGGGTEGTPLALPTTPTPPPAPPEPPTFRARVWMHSAPTERDGYYPGERIRLIAVFAEAVTVEGSPRLAIKIGEHLRLATFSPWIEDDFPPERPSFNQRFEYEVAPDDADADGISVSADAFDFSEGVFRNQAGVEIEVEIFAVSAERSSPNPAAPGRTWTPIGCSGRGSARTNGSVRRPFRVSSGSGTGRRFAWT